MAFVGTSYQIVAALSGLSSTFDIERIAPVEYLDLSRKEEHQPSKKWDPVVFCRYIWNGSQS
jgi:hypothetical protein